MKKHIMYLLSLMLFVTFGSQVCAMDPKQPEKDPIEIPGEHRLFELPREVLANVCLFAPEELQNLSYASKDSRNLVLFVCEHFLTGSNNPADIGMFFKKLPKNKNEKEDFLAILIKLSFHSEFSAEELDLKKLLVLYSFVRKLELRKDDLLKLIKTRINKKLLDTSTRKQEMQTILQIVCECGLLDIAQFSEESYKETFMHQLTCYRNYFDNHPLVVAAEHQNAELAIYIVKTVTPELIYAIASGSNQSFISYFIGIFEKTMLSAAAHGDLALLRELLVFKCKFHSVNILHAIKLAINGSHLEVAQYLCENAKDLIDDLQLTKQFIIATHKKDKMAVIQSDIAIVRFFLAHLKNQLYFEEEFSEYFRHFFENHDSSEKSIERCAQIIDVIFKSFEKKDTTQVVKLLRHLITSISPHKNKDLYDSKVCTMLLAELERRANLDGPNTWAYINLISLLKDGYTIDDQMELEKT